MVAYLGQDRAVLNPKCVVETIKQLGESEYKPAIPILVEYLDFRRPPTEAELQSVKVVDSIPLGDPYPAIAALAEIGGDAVPALLGKLGKEATETVRANAVTTLVFIRRGRASEAVRLLHDAHEREADAGRATRLLKAAKLALNACHPEEKPQCEMELYNSRSR